MNERFAELITRKLSGEATADELTELNQYLRNNPHDQHFSEILTTYWHTQQQAASITGDDKNFNHILELAAQPFNDSVNEVRIFELNAKKIQRARRIKLLKRLSVAAAFTGICFSLGYLYFKQNNQQLATNSSNNEVVVKRGNRSRLLLPDGTQIWLNGDSKLIYNQEFNGTTREVELEGEAYFDVTKDKSRPFIIHTKAMDIKVLGTAFNVKAYAGDKTTEASLIHGSIEASFKDRPNEKIILKPNEKIVFANNGRLAVAQKPVAANKNTIAPNPPIITVTKITYEANRKDSLLAETSWTKNTLVFHSEAFEDLALRLERWYNVKIIFEDEAIKQLKLTGTFEKESIQEVIGYLSSTARFTYKINKDEIKISKK
jgi:transmembrane sensor